MIKIKDLPKFSRPREKLITKGSVNLTNSELLAILLRTGRKNKSVLEISKDIMAKYPIKKLLTLTLSDLTNINGIDSGKAATLLAAFELTKRALEKYDTTLPIIDSPKKAINYFINLSKLNKEHFKALYLNTRNQLIHEETISIGTLNSSLIHPREVFEPAVRYVASLVIVGHNHPSGEIEPSKEDIIITENLVRSGKILGIGIEDHLIIGKNDYFSFKQKGMIL